MLKLGILGLGEGRSAISAALGSSKWKLVQICDLNEALCKKRAEEFHFDQYTTSYNEMLNNPEIDVMAIYTPDKFHAEHIRLALEHGKHVICTKPLLNDLSEAKNLLSVYAKSGKKVFVGQSSRFFEPMIHQRSDYENGAIGSLVTVEASYNADHRWFLNKPWSLDQSFKWLFGGLSHPADLVRWYLPDIEEVMGYGMLSENGRKGGLKNADTMHFIFKAKDGRVARVNGTYSCPVQPSLRESEMTCILRGTDGCSQADYKELRYAITTNKGEEKVITFENKTNYYFRFEGKTHHAGEYQNYMEYFVDCIAKNKTPLPDLKEGIITIALLNAMEMSLNQGKPVRVMDVLKEQGLLNKLEC